MDGLLEDLPLAALKRAGGIITGPAAPPAMPLPQLVPVKAAGSRRGRTGRRSGAGDAPSRC